MTRKIGGERGFGSRAGRERSATSDTSPPRQTSVIQTSTPHSMNLSPRLLIAYKLSAYHPIYSAALRANRVIRMASTQSAKRQKTSKDVPYELIYWPGIPGRGELVRLAFEEAGATYTDTAQREGGVKFVLSQIDTKNVGDATNPPPLAPPILKHGDLTINQTSNILLYLGPRLGLVPSAAEDEDAIYKVNELALTALDGLSNEAHDCHHPVASGLYYEDQKDEAKRKSEDYIANRIPKFLGYFERVLKGEASQGGEWLYGGQLRKRGSGAVPMFGWSEACISKSGG